MNAEETSLPKFNVAENLESDMETNNWYEYDKRTVEILMILMQDNSNYHGLIRLIKT